MKRLILGLGFVGFLLVYPIAKAKELESNMVKIPTHDHHMMGSAFLDKVTVKNLPLERSKLNLRPNHDTIPKNNIGKPDSHPEELDLSDFQKPMMGNIHPLGALIVDRLEAVNVRDDFSMTYDWQAWYGYDEDKLVVRAEGEVDQGTFKNARNEALWGHALTAYWDTQMGVRVDSGLGVDRVWGAFGMQGFAPYWIYFEATAYVGEDGRTAFRLETEYDVLITQKLILQPRIELNFYSENDRTRLVSSGLSNVEAGLRLRYEIAREFAPYIGVEWASFFGSAADYIRGQGKQPEEARFIVGVHFWF